MGRAEVNQATYTPRLSDFELSLHRALTMLERSGRSFRVEKVPLCYMTDFAWASTETRKIVKLEERVVHFLDEKQTVRQTSWDHLYAETCASCTLRPICGGLFNRGNGYDPAELYPVFVPLESIVERILTDPGDPTTRFVNVEEWRTAFEAHNADAAASTGRATESVQVGTISEYGLRLYRSKRASEGRRAAERGVEMERENPDAI